MMERCNLHASGMLEWSLSSPGGHSHQSSTGSRRHWSRSSFTPQARGVYRSGFCQPVKSTRRVGQALHVNSILGGSEGANLMIVLVVNADAVDICDWGFAVLIRLLQQSPFTLHHLSRRAKVRAPRTSASAVRASFDEAAGEAPSLRLPYQVCSVTR